MKIYPFQNLISFILGGLIVFGVMTYVFPDVREVEVSIVTEEKRCKDWGGEFYFDTEWYIYPSTNYLKCLKTYTEGSKKITETLFDYEF